MREGKPAVQYIAPRYIEQNVSLSDDGANDVYHRMRAMWLRGRMNQTRPKNNIVATLGHRPRRLFWLWALISVCWSIWIIEQNWSRAPEPPPFGWGEQHRECRDRLAFWPDGTRMDDDQLNPFIDSILDRMRKEDRQLRDQTRDQWARDVRNKVANCEDAEWRPIAVRQQQLALLGFAFAPPAILFFLGAAIALAWKYYGETIIQTFRRVPRHVRRGLIRLYIVVAVPWIAWFGYMAYADKQIKNREFAVYALPLVPVGAPVLYLAVLWIAAGSRKRAED